jgi:MFS family permease
VGRASQRRSLLPLGLACAYMALVQSGLMLLIGFALLRGTAIGGLSLVSQQVVNLWFVQRRGIAAAAASLGLAAGSMVFPWFFDYLIALYGWRGAYVALAVLVALTILPVAAALFRDRPEKFGLTPDAGLPPVAARPREEPSFTRKQALRTNRVEATQILNMGRGECVERLLIRCSRSRPVFVD